MAALTDDERLAFTARIAALTSALATVIKADKTEYDYARVPERAGLTRIRKAVTDRDGRLPADGERFLTPREIAAAALIADRRYTNGDPAPDGP